MHIPSPRATSSKSEDLFEVALVPSGFLASRFQALSVLHLSKGIHRNPTEESDVFRSVSFPDAAAVFLEANIQNPMHLVFDAPVRTDCFSNPLR